MFGNSSRKPYVSWYVPQIKFACMHVCAQSCPTPCYPMDCSSPDSSVLGILQARILEWVAYPPPGDLPNPRIKPVTPVLASRFFSAGTTWHAWKWALLGILSRCSSPGHSLRAGVFYSAAGLLNMKCPGLVLTCCYRKWPQEAAFPNAPPGYLGNQRLGKVVLLGCGSQRKGPRWTPKGLRLITWILILFWSILEYIVGLITFRYICVNAAGTIAFIFYASVAQLCPTLCDPVDCSSPGSSVGFSRQEYWNGLPFPPPGGVIFHLIHVPYLLYPFLYWWTLFLSALRENCFPFLSFYHLKPSYLLLRTGIFFKLLILLRAYQLW